MSICQHGEHGAICYLCKVLKIEEQQARIEELEKAAQAVVDAKRGHFNLPNSLAMEIEALAAKK